MSTNESSDHRLVRVERAQLPAQMLKLPRAAHPSVQRYGNLISGGSANTRRAYAADLRSYEKFCEQENLTPYPAEEDALPRYVAYLADEEKKLATIRRHLSAIEKQHQLAGHPSVIGTTDLEHVLRGVMVALGMKQKQAPAFTIEHLKSCIEKLDLNTASGLRDRALLLIGFAGAFRRAELVAINLEDLKLEKELLVINLGRSKANQAGKAQEKVLFWSENPLFCPIKAYQDWASRLGGRKKGPLFVSIVRQRKPADGIPTMQRLSTNAVNKLVGKHLGEFEEGVLYTAHSFRSSFITTAKLAGHSNEFIKNQTKHKSDAMLQRYTRLSNVKTFNASKGLGL